MTIKPFRFTVPSDDVGRALKPVEPGQACSEFVSWAWARQRMPYAHCMWCGQHLDKHDMPEQRRLALRAAIDEYQRLNPRPLTCEEVPSPWWERW